LALVAISSCFLSKARQRRRSDGRPCQPQRSRRRGPAPQRACSEASRQASTRDSNHVPGDPETLQRSSGMSRGSSTPEGSRRRRGRSTASSVTQDAEPGAHGRLPPARNWVGLTSGPPRSELLWDVGPSVEMHGCGDKRGARRTVGRDSPSLGRFSGAALTHGSLLFPTRTVTWLAGRWLHCLRCGGPLGPATAYPVRPLRERGDPASVCSKREELRQSDGQAFVEA